MTVKLDVRPLLASGIEPLQAIMEAAATVGPGQALELTAPFEPVPLYGVMAQQGFRHTTERRAADEFVVTFVRQAGGGAV